MNDDKTVRITVAVAEVLRVFLDDVHAPRHGYELMRITGQQSGKLYPILARLEAAGWLTKERETIDPIAEGRPARWLYRLSDKGIATARAELADMAQRINPVNTGIGRLRPQGA